MKLLTTLLFSLLSLSFLAQGSITYAISVQSGTKSSTANIPLVLIENSTFERIEHKTDASGKAVITLDHGKQWVLHVGDMKNYRTLDVPGNGDLQGSMSLTYNVENWNRINQPPVDRSKIQLKTVAQKGITNQDIDPSHSIVNITFKNKSGKGWSGLPVQLTCYENLTSYTTVTNGSGKASFKVPINQNYQLDVDGEPDYDYCDIGKMASIKNKNYLFEKIEFTEKLDNEGFLVQTFKETPRATSNRTLVNLKIIGGPNGGANEVVTINQTYSSNQYKVTTDKDGLAQILLPKQNRYLINFEFQPSADLLDLTDFRGISETSGTFRYTPDERLQYPERFIPSEETIRFYDLNDFGSAQPDPNSNELVMVTAKWGNKKINSGSKEAILELGFTAKKPLKNGPKQPLNISFVLDKSGSMGGESFDELKKAMLTFIDQLSDDDQVSLIFFDTETIIAYPQSKPRKNVLKDIIYTVQPGGGTSIFDGLKTGYEEISKTLDPSKTNRVILLTDGYGSKPIDFILEQSKAYFSKGVTVSCIGVGEYYNASLLQLLSKYSGGALHHVITPESMNTAFKNEFEQLYYPIANGLKVEVKYNDKIIYKTLYGVDEESNKNGSVNFKLPKVYASMNRLALVKFKLTTPTADIEKEKIIITTSYYDEVNQKEVSIVKEMNLEWTEETNLEMIHDQQVKELYSVATINQVLKSIADLCNEKQYAEARKNLSETCQQLIQQHENKFSAELLPLIKELEGFIKALDYYLKK